MKFLCAILPPSIEQRPMNLSESYGKLKGEGTLENPVESGAEGVRRQGAESLRQKDRSTQSVSRGRIRMHTAMFFGAVDFLSAAFLLFKMKE